MAADMEHAIGVRLLDRTPKGVDLWTRIASVWHGCLRRVAARYFLCGSKHPLARRRRIDLAELVDEPWLFPHESIFSAYLTQAFETNGLAAPRFGVRSYSVAQRVSLLTTKRFVSAESGSVLRSNAAKFPIKVLPVEHTTRPWPIGIVTLKNRTVSPVMKTFLDYVRQVAKPMAKKSS
jgi:DNA-binding transcriptional LysR family regulator